jgi:hypothetical protein
VDPPTDGSETKDGHETYNQGMAPSSLSHCGPDSTSDDLVVFGEYGVYMVNHRRNLSVLDYTDCMCQTRWKLYQSKNRMQIMKKYLEVF